jgi:hypothetical protein
MRGQTHRARLLEQRGPLGAIDARSRPPEQVLPEQAARDDVPRVALGLEERVALKGRALRGVHFGEQSVSSAVRLGPDARRAALLTRVRPGSAANQGAQPPADGTGFTGVRIRRRAAKRIGGSRPHVPCPAPPRPDPDTLARV